jgi:hypothetical protein
MTPATMPQVEVEQFHTSPRVANSSAAVEFYATRLGFVHAVTWGEPATMAGVDIGETPDLSRDRDARSAGVLAVLRRR